MSKILDEIADILDLEEVNPEQVLADLETWDSLAKISAISLAHEQYKKTITLDLNEKCGSCHGAGGFDEKTCSTCGGSGRIISEQRSLFGVFQTQTTCNTCGAAVMFDLLCYIDFDAVARTEDGWDDFDI